VPEWEPSLKLIAEDRSISEVILSGGDPLMWDDQKLASLVERVESMPHVSRLRLHTRMPVVVPQRITTALLSALSSTRLRTIIVIHANHDRELSSLVRQATERMAAQGFALLNQSVLLAGVNDDVAVLGRLSERLFDCSVLPYYLHQLDRVTGSGHFQVPIERGLELVEQLRARLPGYLVPRYVREMPGKPSKSVLA
jgi:KamA family protein